MRDWHSTYLSLGLRSVHKTSLTSNVRYNICLNCLSGWESIAFERNGVPDCQPQNRIPSFLCQNVHCKVVVNTLNADFVTQLPEGSKNNYTNTLDKIAVDLIWFKRTFYACILALIQVLCDFEKMGSFVLALGSHQTKLCLNMFVVNYFITRNIYYICIQYFKQIRKRMRHLEILFKLKCNLRQNMSTVSLCH